MIEVLAQEYDPVIVYEQIEKTAQPLLLESQNQDQELAKISIIVLNPISSICYQNHQLLVDQKIVDEDPLDYINYQLNQKTTEQTIEFDGGFVGAISYDYGLELLDIPNPQNDDYPQIIGGIYHQAIIFDHLNQQTKLFNRSGSVEHMFKYLVTSEQVEKQKLNYQPQLSIGQTEYTNTITKIKDYIAAGDLYEMNYTILYEEEQKLDSWSLYKQLKSSNPAPYAAYLNFTDLQIVSTSPELFFERQVDTILTQPMKGTAPRSLNNEQDLINYQQLVNSDKDKSELLMIIDLMRNDISKIAKPHSVKVTNPFLIKKYPTVYQQVANVGGVLQEDVDFAQIFRALFPSGSITGAPKKRTMEVIQELEKRNRNFYTGAIGYYAYNQKACFNVAIRTVVANNNNYQFGVGGAVVWDSSAKAEFSECQTKAKAILNALRNENDYS